MISVLPLNNSQSITFLVFDSSMVFDNSGTPCQEKGREDVYYYYYYYEITRQIAS